MTQPTYIADAEVRDAFTCALATYRQRTDPSTGYVPPVQRRPATRPKPRKRLDGVVPSSTENAFDWLEQADAYLKDRAQDAPLDGNALQKLWDSNYKFRYAPRSQPFPADALATYRLTQLQWHDVFNKVKSYVGAKEVYDPETYRGSSFEPFELIANIASKVAKNIKGHRYRYRQAVDYLGKKGIDVAAMTTDERNQAKKDALEADRYPRTYL